MTKYAVKASNLTSSGQVSKDHLGHKVMASVFSDTDGVLKQGNTVTGVHYAGLVRKLCEAVKESSHIGCYFTMAIYLRTPPLLPWSLCLSAASNSSLNHLILQIWLHWISKGPDIYRNHCMGRLLRTMKQSLWP